MNSLSIFKKFLIRDYCKNRFAIVLIKITTLLAFVFAISSCASNLENLAKHEQELRAKQTLNSYLALEYLQYSRGLSNKNNRQDSNYFALKGIKSAKNQDVFAEVIENWPQNSYLNNSQIEQANIARQRLVGLFFDQRVRQVLPIQLANLQLLYDCWLSQKLELDMTGCKTLFFKLESEINGYLEAMKPAKEIKVVTIAEPQFTHFDIYFDLNSYNFNSKADKIFVELFEYLATLNGDYKILLVGNSDRIGKKLSNDVIARNRSLVVRDRLTKNGIPDELIQIKSFGEDSPKVISASDEQNENNRRVGVYILKGNDDISIIPLPLIDNYIYKQDIVKYRKTRGI